MKTQLNAIVVAVLALGAAFSCAGRAKDPSVAGETASEAPNAEEDGARSTPSVSGYSTEADECSDRPCSVNAECCAGFSCGFDPDRSRVQRYCQGG